MPWQLWFLRPLGHPLIPCGDEHDFAPRQPPLIASGNSHRYLATVRLRFFARPHQSRRQRSQMEDGASGRETTEVRRTMVTH